MIIGQGLAGSILTLKLLEKGFSVIVIDQPMPGSASHVAAGIINPITGHRLNITDNIEIFMPLALTFYKTLERQINQTLIKSLSQLRLIKNQGQLDYWHKRKTQDSHAPYLGKLLDSHIDFIEPAYGIAEILGTYQVTTTALLKHCRDKLANEGFLLEKAFNTDQLDIGSTELKYAGVSAQNIIFCEGYRANNNPWWKHLPFKLAKGELLEMSSEKPLLHTTQNMLNWGNWVVPNISEKNNHFTLGASYIWNDTSVTKSPEIAHQLLTALSERTTLDKDSVNIINHLTGIRPTTLHRYPFIGAHKDDARVHCFNGFGSKGCMTIPYYADRLIDFFAHKAPLPKETTRYL